MEQRERPSDPKGSIKERLDRLAKDVKRLPDRRKEMLEELMKKKLLDTPEVCEILGISQPTLRRAISCGRIKAVKIGRLLRFSADEIYRLMQESEQTITPLELSEVLGCKLDIIRRALKTGKIKGFRFADAGRWRIPILEMKRICKEGIPKEND